MSYVMKHHHVKRQAYKFSSVSLNNMQHIRKRKDITKNSSAFFLGCLRLYQFRFQLQIYQALVVVLIVIIIIITLIIIIIIIIIIIMSHHLFLAVKIRNNSKYFGIVMDQIAEENKQTCEEELIEYLKELRLTSLQNKVFLNFAL
jgi:hypothetical protein